jgi:hypothetical protein
MDEEEREEYRQWSMKAGRGDPFYHDRLMGR